MAGVDDTWEPSDTEIDDALELYYKFLTEASATKETREDVFAAVDTSLRQSHVRPVFTWITLNTPDRIYDIDSILPE